jgi:hypothetical protein
LIINTWFIWFIEKSIKYSNIKKLNRRDSFKTILLGTIAGATLATTSCEQDVPEVTENASELGLYGRTPKEIERDNELLSQVYFDEQELATIAILADIILPATKTAGSATEAGVVEFIEFIVKDLPDNQLPIRGGLMWLNSESNRRFKKTFAELNNSQQIEIIDDIAYPDDNNEKPELAPGIKFFDKIRGLVVTGYYTSKMGLEDLGYQGNRPNVWDGVPQDVLDKHGMKYDEDWLPKFVDQSKRNIQAEWDENMNLIT